MSELLASLEGKELKDMRSLASTNCQDAQGLHDRSGVETSLPQVIYLVPLVRIIHVLFMEVFSLMPWT